MYLHKVYAMFKKQTIQRTSERWQGGHVEEPARAWRQMAGPPSHASMCVHD